MRARVLTIPIALALAALIASLGTSPVVRAATPKFLTLPFDSPKHIHIQRGWWTPESLGGPFTLKHHAIDYIYGTLDVVSSWESFPVVAAAAGEACAEVVGKGACFDSGEIMGNRVLVKHTVDGKVYYTFYNHLKSIDSAIPTGGKTVHVKQGQLIGIAGASNSPGFIHLHWELLDSNKKPIDPYGLYTSSRQYPDPKGKNGIMSGNKNYFLTNPPTVLNAAPQPTPSPTPSPMPKPTHRPPATSPPPSPVGTVPAASGVSSPSSSQAPAAVASAAGVLPGSGTSPPADTPSSGSLALTTIVAGVVAIACFAFLATVLLLRRRSPRIGFGP